MGKQILSMQIKTDPSDFEPLSKGFFKDEKENLEEIGFWKASWIRLKENKIAMAALVVILIIVLFAVLGPILSPYSYDQQIRGDENMTPCLAHPFGTDRLGRDLLVRCMVGTRISLAVGVVSALIVLVIGSIYGAISGLVGGKVDIAMMRLVDIVYSVPEILLIVVFKLVLDDPLNYLVTNVDFFRPLQKIGSGLLAIFIVYGCLYWVGMARIVRGPGASAKGDGICNGCQGSGSQQKEADQGSSAAQLHRPADRHGYASDSLRYFYRGILKLPGNRRVSPYGKSWFPDFRRSGKHQLQSLQDDLSGADYQSYYSCL